ncbi:hypothetical protein ACON3F_15180 [Providencia hangzhouensis]|uniref:hypothetical protein n=1 Tax=Providencia TaxID=586 RepID=UPI000D8F7F47|nr:MULTISPECIES: hypothetical protein [Providencia]PYZ59103.1 hypothetical protein DNK63_08250 [Providencia rettgeri]QIF66236.1 hypothetical protein FVA72_12240 [Providencia sp. 1709051003]WOB93597.1 hypothetical protein P3L54_12105 [Providencia sp. PROV099]
MKNINVLAITFFLLGLSPTVNAQSLMKTFSYCDAAFFKKIKDDPVLNDISNALKHNQLGTNEHVSVNLNFSPTGIVTFNRFFVSHSNFDKHDGFAYLGLRDQYYFWGFETTQSLEEVVRYTSSRIAIIKVGNTYIYSPMIRHNLQSKWVFNEHATQDYNLEPNAAEKMLIIEKDEQRGVVRFLCTLQGNVTDEDLHYVGLK